MRLGIVTARVGRNDGQGRVNREIAVEAQRRGHTVTLFSEQVDADLADLPGIRTAIASPPTWLPSRLLRDQAFAAWTACRIAGARGNCDALLSNGFATWARSDVNAVHFVHDAWARSPWHPWRQRRSAGSLYAWTYSALNRRLERDAFRRARRLVAVSGKVQRELVSLGCPPEHVTVIPNGVDSKEFRPGPSERARFGLPDEVPVALFAGDLRSPRKNLDTVLRALGPLPALHLAVAGSAERTSYPGLARSLGLGARVHFLGFQRDMPALMRSVDLLLFPSRYEPCGLVLLEALATGLPVVTARSTGGAEMLSPAVGAVLEDSEDHVGLAHAIAPLLERGERRAAIATEARRIAQAHSWQAMAARYIDLLAEAAEHRHG